MPSKYKYVKTIFGKKWTFCIFTAQQRDVEFDLTRLVDSLSSASSSSSVGWSKRWSCDADNWRISDKFIFPFPVGELTPDNIELSTCSQFYQYFTKAFYDNILVTKKLQSQTVSKMLIKLTLVIHFIMIIISSMQRIVALVSTFRCSHQPKNKPKLFYNDLALIVF